MLYKILLFFFLAHFISGQESATSFYKFIDSSASSTYISEESGSTLYDSKRAIQNNPSYWCSAGNHSKDEEVHWIGYLNSKGFIKGIKIFWEYSPELVRISVSSDGHNFKNVFDFKKVSSSEASFEEIYFFKRLEESLAVKISMKNCIHKFFGIREVKLLGAGNPFFLLVSGITSEYEMCLQVEEGLVNEENAPVILDSCINALANNDGRELWKSNSNNQIISALSNPPKCLVVLNLDNIENSKIVLYDCLRALEDGDGKSNWVFESNSQIRLQKTGESLCISQKNVYGNKPGIHDILLNFDVSIDVTSVLDNDHTPENILDTNKTTFWSSALFSDNFEHQVELTLDLNTIVEISRVKVLWEYAPLHYSINISNDNNKYTVVAENVANPSITTIDSLKNRNTRFIKIIMFKPHPTLGKIDDKFIYGIRSIEVQANNLDSIVNFCRDAANSDDARDKYFVEYITEFDKKLTDKLINIEDDVSKNIQSISKNLATLEEVVPNISNCLDEKKTYEDQIKESQDKANELNDKISTLLSVNVIKELDLIRVGILPGDTSSFPAEDCSVIKSIKENADSGFYWIKPRCASEPLRVFCDMESSTSIFIWNGNPPKETNQLITNLINSIDDIRFHCAEVGLEPFILRSKQQLNSLILALKKIGFSLNGKTNIPLAYDYACDHGSCSGKFHDLLNGNIDLTTLIYLKTSELPDSTKNRQTAGISYDDGSFRFFNLETSDISAIVCSTNSTENDFAIQYLNITCETTALEDNFNAIINTNIIVFCPIGCDTEKFKHIPVYGSKGLYADNSSICKAAIHSNVIDKKGGLVNLTIESGLDFYEGSISNNIESISLNKTDTGLFDIIKKEEGTEGEENIKQEISILPHRTIRLSNLIENCPLDLFQFSQTAFLQKNETIIKSSINEKINIDDENNEEIVHLHEIINILLNNIDAIHGVDPSVIANVQGETIRVIEKTKKELKPADVVSKKQIEHAINLYNLTENLAVYLFELSEKYIHNLDKLKERLEELKGFQKIAYNFGTFQLNYETMNFSTHFNTFDSKSIKNKPSTWGYTNIDIEGHKNSIGQTKSIVSKDIAEGTFAKLKGLNFFDIELTVSFLAKGFGCIGIVFRAKDDFNFYLFELCDKEGVKRLSKVENGNVDILKEIHDDVLINNVWNKIKIVTSHANIDIFTVTEDNKDIKILDALDERFLSGTVGFYSQILGQGAFFDDLIVKARPCSELSQTQGGIKTTKNVSDFTSSEISVISCPFYKENFININSFYTIINDTDFKWSFEKENETNFLLCSQNIESVQAKKDTFSIALIKHNPCNGGFLTFDLNVIFNENKNESNIKVLFHFKDEANFNALEISNNNLRFLSFVNRKINVLSELNVTEKKQFKPINNEWINVKLHFSHSNFKAIISGSLTNTFELSTKNIRSNIIHLGNVAFSVHNIIEAKFDAILLSPLIPGKDEQFLQVNLKSWASCEKSVHVLNRRNACETDIFPNETKEKHIECIKNFCEECCKHHTELLDANEKKECEKHCKENDKLALKMQNVFEKFINKCISLEKNIDYKKCKSSDKHCQKEVCVFCCKKHNPEFNKEFEEISSHEFKQIKEKEIIECQFQCDQIVGSIS